MISQAIPKVKTLITDAMMFGRRCRRIRRRSEQPAARAAITYSYSHVASTDLRFYRRLGVPAAQHGPRSYPMFAATPNEFIYVKDLLDTAKVHAGTILDYLA